MALQAIDISFSYGPRFALDRASIDVGAGELLGIIGSNGSGKSTLMRITSGLLPAASGRVLLDGEPIESYTPNRRARHLAYMPQSHRPSFEFTVEQTVLLGRMPYRSGNGGFERQEDLDVAEEMIELFELGALRDESITRLSGGELQRVMLARTMAQGTGTIVLDEPTSHLDIAHQQSVMMTLRRLIERRNLSIIITMHDLNLASIFSDRIAAVVAGRVVAQGTPEEVLTRQTLRQLFGTELEVEPGAYGGGPAVRYRDPYIGGQTHGE